MIINAIVLLLADRKVFLLAPTGNVAVVVGGQVRDDYVLAC